MAIRSTLDQYGDRPIYFAKVADLVTQAGKIDLFAELIEQEETLAR
jgi:hypothetical protein